MIRFAAEEARACTVPQTVRGVDTSLQWLAGAKQTSTQLLIGTSSSMESQLQNELRIPINHSKLRSDFPIMAHPWAEHPKTE